MNNTLVILEELNEKYCRLHTEYEEHYWITYMGNKDKDGEFQETISALNKFRENREILKKILNLVETETDEQLKARLSNWKHFFELYQVPEQARELRERITELETRILTKHAETKYSYINPKTLQRCEVPSNKLSLMIATEQDEDIRKACFDWREEAAKIVVNEYVELIKMRNEYARILGYRNFYHYKAQIGEQMDETEIFQIFDEICIKLAPFFRSRLEELKKSNPNICKPWNMWYSIAWNFRREEDKYFPMETIVDIWGRTFAALWIDYRGWLMRLDLLERNMKYNNWFCHQPVLVHYKDSNRIPWEVNFTCNAIIWQIGSWASTGRTLFHEGWHAAHFINMDNQDTILNTEYPPMSAAWAETQSMFLEEIMASPEWKLRYAKSLDWKSYPFDLFERKIRKTFILEPLHMLSMSSIIEFEGRMYSESDLTSEKVIQIAQETSTKYHQYNSPSTHILMVSHLYSWYASCSYQSYALATLALTQWREVMFEKYWYIVDNPAIWAEMTKVWEFWSSKGFSQLVEIATGKKLSPETFINSIVNWEEHVISEAKKHIKTMESIPEFTGEPDLNAQILIVDWGQVLATNKNWFSQMCTKFRKYVEKIKSKET